MRKLSFVSILAVMLWSCSSGSKNNEQPTTEPTDTSSTDANNDTTALIEEESMASGIDSLKIMMSEAEVITIMGEPDRKETAASSKKMVVEDWFYGDNQKVRMINGEVNFVVKDIAREQELLKQLRDAKKNGDEAEIKRLMEELTKGQNQ